jgi:uncharacterized repeat protein (TIGR02543 family)
MAITLAQSKVGLANKIDQAVIDEFRRQSFILDKLPFDNAVSPGTGGSTLTYGYVFLKTPSTAAFRDINQDYTTSEAIKDEKTAKLKIFGGKAKVDRVIEDTAAKSELAFQLEQAVTAAKNLFHYTFINGDSANNADEFDGIDKLLTGTATELGVGAAKFDISSEAALAQNYNSFIDSIDEFLSKLKRKPDMLIGNAKMILKIKSAARRAGYYERTKDDFGKTVDNYNGIPLVDFGKFYDGANSIDIVRVMEDGTSPLYAVCLDLAGTHGVSPVGNNVIKTYKDLMTETGVLKGVEVEAVMAVVIKDSTAAGVLRNIRVSPATQYTINYELNGGTGDASATYTSDDLPYTLQTPTKANETFGGWYDDAGFSGGAITQIDTSNIGNKTLYAKWA